MNINEFVLERPFLYHLTNSTNAQRIINQRRIFSANRLIDLSANSIYQGLKREKRFEHTEIIIDNESYFLRDQRPISEVALAKCLTDNWQVADFLEHLNNRVFMWPTIERLQRHYNRYENENPVIFRFPTSDLLAVNPHVKFCRLNSGATRANSYLGGKAPERGPNTFLTAPNYQLSINSVAEVTFENECDISCDVYISHSPHGNFQLV